MSQVENDDVGGGGKTSHWIAAVIVVVAIVLFIAWARRDPGFDDRVPDPEDAAPALVLTIDGGV